MITLIQGGEAHLFSKQIDQMFRLRARQFNDRLGWQVTVKDDKERDQFDELDPLYALYIDEDGDVIGTYRLLQTSGPHMLSDVFPKLLPHAQAIRSPLVWECTRFCVDTKRAKEKSIRGLNTVTGKLLSSLLEIGLHAGLSHIVNVIDERMERILLRAQCPFERLVDPVKIGTVGTLAILVECSEKNIEHIQIANGITESCINKNDAKRLGIAA